jgi:hypothetical protein
MNVGKAVGTPDPSIKEPGHLNKLTESKQKRKRTYEVRRDDTSPALECSCP